MAKELVGFESSLIFDKMKNPLFKTITRLKGGEVITKTVSFENYQKLLEVSSKEVKEKYRKIPKLPKYYHSGQITDKADTYKVSLFVPAGKHQYIVDQTNEVFNLAFPSLLFVLSVVKGVAQHDSCYALKGNDISDLSELYRYPYGHVSTSGSICMGNVSKRVGEMSNADAFVENFFLGRDAGHYYVPGEFAKPKVELRELVGKVDKKGYFPDNWLIPHKKGDRALTVADVL